MEQTTYDVFISYSRKDYVDEKNNVIQGNEVSKIKETLTRAGITYWFDEEGMYYGEKFTEKIPDSIEASRIFLFLSTKNACASSWTSREIACADEYGKIILPVRIDKTPYNKKVMLRIADLSYIDYGKDPEIGRQEIVNAIKDHLEKIRIEEEEQKRQEKIAKTETEIDDLELKRTEYKKAVSLAQADLEACEAKIQKLQKRLQELRETQVNNQRKESERKADEQNRRYKEETNAKDMVFTVGNVSFKMIPVEGGGFQMGAQKTNPKDENYDAEAYDDESPVHSVKVDKFYLSETVVTQALWKAVLEREPGFNGGWVDRSGRGDNYPAYRVSYNEIVNEFIPELNRMTGKNFRLPTEAEWEYAARGSQKNKSGSKYSGSNAIDKVAWYEGNSNGKTHPVKERQPNGLGLYDMSGNVGEWCEDWYDDKYYSNSSADNPQGPQSGSSRVLRGGRWYDGARGCRASCRSSRDPDSRSYGIGFRLVLPK